jgi:hypothetical protein
MSLVMQRVVSAIENKFTETRRGAGTMTINYRKSIVHTLECGHIVEKVGHCGITPSTRLKCNRCTALARIGR